MQYDGASATLADAHTWRRVRLADWLAEMRRAHRPLPEYIFDQSGAIARGGLGRPLRRLFPWRAILAQEAPGLYVGANGSGNPFHYHAQTWNALVVGRKRWWLYPPNASFYSEVHPLEWLRRRPRRGAGGVDAGAGGADVGAGGARALECEQRAGDVLFVPRLWGHGTLNLGETLGVAMPFALRHGVEWGDHTRASHRVSSAV